MKKNKFKRNNRKNGFYCPLLTQKGNCVVTGQKCIGIKLKTQSFSDKELRELPNHIIDCSTRLVYNDFIEEAPEILRNLENLVLEISEF